MIMNGKNYSEEIKKFFIQNSKNIDERLYHRKRLRSRRAFCKRSTQAKL